MLALQDQGPARRCTADARPAARCGHAEGHLLWPDSAQHCHLLHASAQNFSCECVHCCQTLPQSKTQHLPGTCRSALPVRIANCCCLPRTAQSAARRLSGWTKRPATCRTSLATSTRWPSSCSRRKRGASGGSEGCIGVTFLLFELGLFDWLGLKTLNPLTV